MSTRAPAGAAPATGMQTAQELLGLLDALPASVALWDRDVRLRYGNRRSLVRFGRPADTLLGARLADLVQAHAVELSAQYIDGALAGVPQQVERAAVDWSGQRYNAHQVTHIPNVVGGLVRGYCALAVDITSSLEGYEHARRAREQAALRAVRDRIAGDIGRQHVLDNLTEALERLDATLERAADAVPSLATAADAIDRSIDELRALVPARLSRERDEQSALVAFPGMSGSLEPAGTLPSAAGVGWPPEITGQGWSFDEAAALLDMLPAGVAAWDTSYRNRFANRAAVRWFGRADREEVLGRHAAELLGTEVFEANLPFAAAALAGDLQHFERTVAHPSGLRHVQAWYAPILDEGTVIGFASFVVDVTPRVEAELALQDARADLASARERERIADQLHNLVIQRLYAAGLAATRPVPTVGDTQLQSVQDGILSALADLEAAMTTLHETVGVLDLLPALAHLVHDATQPHGVAAVIENVGSVDYVPPDVAAELLVVADAALENVAVHSGASSVVVTIAADAAGVWLRVADNGVGLGAAPDRRGMAEMASRAERLGGTCDWRANQPTGTVVDFRVPLP